MGQSTWGLLITSVTGHVLPDFDNNLREATMGDNTDEKLEADFEGGTSGASETYPMQCSALRKNGYVMIKGRPCKIVEMSTSKTGKHGHAKVHLVALDICPSTHNMNVPNVTRKDYQFIQVDDNFVTMMDNDTGDQKEDLKLPDDDIGKEILEKEEKGQDFLVTVLTACGEEKIVGTKVMTN